MLRRRLVPIGSCMVFMIALCVIAESASAGDCSCGYGFGHTYNVYVDDYIPYYALHPPVYYSYPVARTYGYSPFAYPPSVMTPDVQPAPPQTMINPFVPQKPASKVASNHTASAPKMIVNPFVKQAPNKRIADVAGRAQIVYPIAQTGKPAASR